MAAERQACEACGKARVLKAIDSGQLLCVTCRKEFGNSRGEAHASEATVKRLRNAGFELSNWATKADCARFDGILHCRGRGIDLPNDATDSDIESAMRNISDDFLMGVAGEQFRQHVVKKLAIGEPLFFIPEPDNSHDANAIAITRRDGEVVGYVKRELNVSFLDQLESSQIEAHVEKFYKNVEHVDVVLKVKKFPHRVPREHGVTLRHTSGSESGILSKVFSLFTSK